ncbi:MAG: hypothetical protein CVV02_13615 [Firmicutes bacterium HGW-Firmicutes-7]|nr:MAG: hypothetical protein CVV02_13615 [Firmicutes bacterium HGW-Firmicutes-7]
MSMNQTTSIYSREQIIDAAFELLRKKGWRAVSTRAIAKELGCSTMPIYSHVHSTDELLQELRIKSRMVLKDFQQRKYTEHVFLNLAFGYVVFARDEKNIFKFISIDAPIEFNAENSSSLKSSFFSEFSADSEEAKALAALASSGQDSLIQYTWIFTHGLAMLLNADNATPISEKTILTLLMNAGEAFYVLGTRKGE